MNFHAGELSAPTNDINTTVALALLTSVTYFFAGITKKGIGYFKRYLQPTPVLLPINILEDFTKPLSLSFRLFGNILADELTVTVLTMLVPLIIPITYYGFRCFCKFNSSINFFNLSCCLYCGSCRRHH